MIGMVLVIAFQITLQLVLKAADYALMGFVVAYVGRRGWDAARKGK